MKEERVHSSHMPLHPAYNNLKAIACVGDNKLSASQPSRKTKV